MKKSAEYFWFPIAIMAMLNACGGSHENADDRIGEYIYSKDVANVRGMLNHGFDPNTVVHDYASDSTLTTPLYIAIGEGRDSIVSLLLARGADPNKTLPDLFFTPIWHAVALREGFSNTQLQNSLDSLAGDSGGVDRIRRYNTIIIALLRHAASPNCADKIGETPLHIASKFCDSLTISELLMYGADPSVKDIHGKTPLDLAKEANCSSVLAVFQRYENGKK